MSINYVKNDDLTVTLTMSEELFSEFFCFCADCGELIFIRDAMRIDGEYYCQNCTTSCDICGRYLRCRDAYQTVDSDYDYCEHCNVIYAPVLAKYGIAYERDDSKKDNAECYCLGYLEGHRPDLDFGNMDDYADVDEDSIVLDIKAEEHKYLHRDFHIIGDLALKYCGDNYGDNCVRSFLTSYANHYYAPQIADIKSRGLIAIKDWLEKVYEIEEASELLHTELTEDCLTVTVDKSPAIAFMYQANQKPSKYYIEQTRTLYSAIADACDLGFALEYYNEDGATRFKFLKRYYK